MKQSSEKLEQQMRNLANHHKQLMNLHSLLTTQQMMSQSNMTIVQHVIQ